MLTTSLVYIEGDSMTNQFNCYEITVSGQKPMLNNSIERDQVTLYTNDINGTDKTNPDANNADLWSTKGGPFKENARPKEHIGEEVQCKQKVTYESTDQIRSLEVHQDDMDIQKYS